MHTYLPPNNYFLLPSISNKMFETAIRLPEAENILIEYGQYWCSIICFSSTGGFKTSAIYLQGDNPVTTNNFT